MFYKIYFEFVLKNTFMDGLIHPWEWMDEFDFY